MLLGFFVLFIIFVFMGLITWQIYYLHGLIYKGFGERHYERYGHSFPFGIYSIFGKKGYIAILTIFYAVGLVGSVVILLTFLIELFR
jgi:hypothetical protein